MPIIENHKEMVPFEHYTEQFKTLNPEEAAARCEVPYDTEKQAFSIRFLYEDYTLYWPDFRIESANPNAFALKNLPAQMLLMRFLLEGAASVAGRKFLTYRELPWGEVYLKPFTGRCLTRAAFSFGTRLSAFCKAAETLPCEKLDSGDASYAFEMLPGYTLRMIVWEGDDEFPPNTQILYSDNFRAVFSAEDRTVMAELLITDLKKRM